MVSGLALYSWEVGELRRLVGRCFHQYDPAILRQHQQNTLIAQPDKLAIAIASALSHALAVLQVDAGEDAAIETVDIPSWTTKSLNSGFNPVDVQRSSTFQSPAPPASC
jgi:hypothetical protein